MFKIIEIVIIMVVFSAALGFFIWYFINEIRGKKACASCAVRDFCVESKVKKNRHDNKQ
jgi:hypothetical protein